MSCTTGHPLLYFVNSATALPRHASILLRWKSLSKQAWIYRVGSAFSGARLLLPDKVPTQSSQRNPTHLIQHEPMQEHCGRRRPKLGQGLK
jgi:hypothetical protein